MLSEIAKFLVLTVLIVAVARFLLYQPAKAIAHRLKFSNHGSGQLLGYLTSAPELVATVAVAATGLFATVAYNILSSNAINVVLALAAAMLYGQARNLFARQFWREQAMIAASIAVPVLLLMSGQLESGWVIPFFLVGYVAYVIVVRRISADGAAPVDPEPEVQAETVYRIGTKVFILLNGAAILAALVGLYFLGSALGSSVFELGTTFGVPEVVLGIAIGVVTSLPELTTFFSSYAWHRNNQSERANEEVVHNLLASNVSNLLLIQTVGLAVFLFAAG